MTMGELISKFVRIERQDAPGGGLAAASFERHAANAFQAYVSGMTNFGVARAGILYGRFEEVGGGEEEGGAQEGGADAEMEESAAAEAGANGKENGGGGGDGEEQEKEKEKPPKSVVARVEAIFEPPQECTADGVQMERGGPDEQLADFVAEQLGCVFCFCFFFFLFFTFCFGFIYFSSLSQTRFSNKKHGHRVHHHLSDSQPPQGRLDPGPVQKAPRLYRL